METTTNYGLKKPAGSDYYNIEDFNYNADAIDTALEDKMDKTGGTFTGTTTVEAVSPIRQWKTQDGKIYYISSGGSGDGAYFDLGTYIDGTAYSMVRWDKDGKVTYVKDQGAFRTALGINKLLWEGSAGSGATITIPGKDNYRIFAMFFENSNVPIIAVRSGATLRGSMLSAHEAGTVTNYYIYGTLNGDIFTITRIGYMSHVAGNTHGAFTVFANLKQIYGIV